MSNYDLINKLEELPYFNTLLKQGIIPMNWVDYKVIYEFYKCTLEQLTREGLPKRTALRTAKTITADEYSIAESSVYKIIQKMRG